MMQKEPFTHLKLQFQLQIPESSVQRLILGPN